MLIEIFIRPFVLISFSTDQSQGLRDTSNFSVKRNNFFQRCVKIFENQLSLEIYSPSLPTRK